MDEQYDIIFLGTGLKECILSALMSKKGKKVLHIDSNDFYGGEGASLSPLSKYYQHIGKIKDIDEPIKDCESVKDWNIDLMPKLIMARGRLINLLIKTGVTRYIEFANIEASYVLQNTKIRKVPATETEALTSGLVGLFDKKKLKDFVGYVIDCSENNKDEKMLKSKTMEDIYRSWGLKDHIINFLEHAVALHHDDAFIKNNAYESIADMYTYLSSSKDYKSPYVYPFYGLGELPQGFARLSAVYGGTYMLRTKVDSIDMEDGKVVGFSSEGKQARAPIIMASPSYAREHVILRHKIVRAIYLLKESDAPDFKKVNSCQHIITAKYCNRNHDIYVLKLGESLKVCAKGYCIILINTIQENAEYTLDIKPAKTLLSGFISEHVWVTDYFEPVDSGKDSGLIISKSMDAATHFCNDIKDIENIYTRMTGEVLDLSTADADK
ncbi:hypothetical protein A3Q56_01218 [Intoshia linei]|uniref:Rab GDP dissociation inhibitor n=1 Tax=Intoshia linei TaxID=1819745 RepID=A0A177BBN2_9BILA|nr:hypothetical protein A3Q56_01218 [Intoshia linei]